MQPIHSSGRRLLIDEIGIEYVRWDEFVLKSVFQPVFCPQGEMLTPCGVEAMALPVSMGHRMGVAAFLGRLAPTDRREANRLLRLLHVGNHANTGVDGLRLFLNWEVNEDMTGFAADLADLRERLAENSLDPAMVVAELVGGAMPDQEVLLAERIRGAGLGIAIDDFGAGAPDLERMHALAPDTVKIDGAWFRRISVSPGASQLLCTLVSRLRAGGARVLVQGIETPAQLDVALGTGADYIQGFLLARPAPAGAVFNAEPLRVSSVMERSAKIIPLFGRA